MDQARLRRLQIGVCCFSGIAGGPDFGFAPFALGNVTVDEDVTPIGHCVAADLDNAAAQIGRPLTTTGALQVNLLQPGNTYGERIRQWDMSVKKIIRFSGQRLTLGVDFYNLTNSNVSLAFNQTFVPGTPGWGFPTSYMNPRVIRLNAEYSW